MSATIVSPRSEFAGILGRSKLSAPAAGRMRPDRLNSWFDRLMLQSGLGMSPPMVLLLSVCATITAGGTVFVIQENLLTTAIAAMAGFLLPITL